MRWLGGTDFVFSVPTSGVFKWNASGAKPPTMLARRGNGRKEIWLARDVAVSENRYVVSASLLSLGWGQIDSKEVGLENLYAMEHVADLDLRGDRVVLLGAQRDDQGRFAPDGAIAWLGQAGKSPEDLRPVLYSQDGEGSESTGACGMMMMGACRFLDDGSVVLVPGVEEGVFHLDESGKLVRTWTSEAVGFDAGCNLGEEEIFRLSADEPARWAFVNQRRMVDEILPLEGGPGIVVRAVKDGKVRWDLRTLNAEGGWDSTAIPISSPSALAHLKADVAGDQVVFLVWTWGLPPAGPEYPSRLVTLKLER